MAEGILAAVRKDPAWNDQTHSISADNDELSAGERQHRPQAERRERAGNAQTNQRYDRKSQLQLSPSQ